MYVISERLINPIIHEGVPRKESEAKVEPFLAWDILQEAGLGQLWDIPIEDIEVAKTAIVLDSFPQKLTLHEKRRIFAARLWFLDGSFTRIKTYIGENKSPSLDSLVSSLWDKSNIDNRFEDVQETIEAVDKLTGKNRDVLRFMLILRKFRELEDQGLEDDEILAQREKILRDRNRKRAREYGFLRMKRAGDTDTRIVDNLKINSKQLKEIRDELLSQGLIAPVTESGKLITAAEKKLRLKVSYFLEQKSPPPNRKKAVEDFRQFCFQVGNLRTQYPELTYEEIASKLTTNVHRVQSALRVLIRADLIPKITNSRILHRNDVDVQDESEIFRLRREEPLLSQAQIAKRIGKSKSRVGHFISKGIRERKISRKRALPKKMQPKQ
jgi:predicted transcriptional regulator